MSRERWFIWKRKAREYKRTKEYKLAIKRDFYQRFCGKCGGTMIAYVFPKSELSFSSKTGTIILKEVGVDYKCENNVRFITHDSFSVTEPAWAHKEEIESFFNDEILIKLKAEYDWMRDSK